MSKHGTHSAYIHGCRCDECRAAHATYNRDYDRHNKQKKLARDCRGYQRNKEKRLAQVAEYYRSDRGLQVARKHNSKRRAAKRNQFIEDVDPLIVYQMHGGMCGICKDFVHQGDFHVDHVIPLSRGGLHGYINVQPAHPTCNLRKHTRMEMT